MDETLKDNSSSASAKVERSAPKLLRYPLRSASKPKEEKPPLIDASNSSAARARSRIVPNVSKSVSVIDLSGKEKSVKPPRRQSIPSKSSATPPKLARSIAPISEARPKKPSGSQAKVDTPVSDILNRRKFSVLSSSSYWVSQIKVSESAAKHSISLGFFKLALDAGCEPLQLLRDELKAYVCRHNLAEFEEQVKDLLGSYSILEAFEQLQVSESCSIVPEDETRSSDDDVRSSSRSDIQKLLSKPSNSGATKTSQAKGTKKEKTHNESISRPSRSGKTNCDNSKLGVRAGGGSSRQTGKPKQRKPEPTEDCDIVKKQGKKPDSEQGSVGCLAENELQENKENMDAATLQAED